MQTSMTVGMNLSVCVLIRMCVCASVCAFASGRQYTGCHCLCGRVIEEEVVEGERHKTKRVRDRKTS